MFSTPYAGGPVWGGAYPAAYGGYGMYPAASPYGLYQFNQQHGHPELQELYEIENLDAEPNPPNWNTDKVKIFTPGQSDAQFILDSIEMNLGGKEYNGQWSSLRYALMFLPGVHDINARIGYYQSVHGLGRKPEDTTLVGLASWDQSSYHGCLANFWRSAENVKVSNKWKSMTWAVSQAAPIRRIEVDGDLMLSDKGYASGGYIADSKVSGTIKPGSQ
jgi:hypothetical protein